MGAVVAAPIGVITGLTVEADILRPLAERGLIRLGVAGASEQRARDLARRFADEGARGLLSFGICGGLVGAVRVGDLVLAERVIHPEGPTVETHLPWRLALLGALQRSRGVSVRSGALVGSAVLVEQPLDKTALNVRHRAVAVDMESHAVATVAQEAGLPLLILRTCSDAAERAFPIAALEAMSPDGSFRLGPVLRAVARKPWVVPGLLRLGMETRHALTTLKRVVREEGALLGVGS